MKESEEDDIHMHPLLAQDMEMVRVLYGERCLSHRSESNVFFFFFFFFFFYIQFNSLVCTFPWSFTLVGITEACGLSVIMITIFFIYTETSFIYIFTHLYHCVVILSYEL